MKNQQWRTNHCHRITNHQPNSLCLWLSLINATEPMSSSQLVAKQYFTPQLQQCQAGCSNHGWRPKSLALMELPKTNAQPLRDVETTHIRNWLRNYDMQYMCLGCVFSWKDHVTSAVLGLFDHGGTSASRATENWKKRSKSLTDLERSSMWCVDAWERYLNLWFTHRRFQGCDRKLPHFWWRSCSRKRTDWSWNRSIAV